MAATIAHDRTYDGGSRHGTAFKDGRLIRLVEFHQGNVIRFTDIEGNKLYETDILRGFDGFIPQEVVAETSSFGTPHVVLVVTGFDANTSGTSRQIVIATDYPVAPPEF